MDIPTGQQTVYAFDFDGVICDSARENGLTTWRALRAQWPARVPERPPEGLLETFLRCRPAIETGYQNIPLMWMLLDGVAPERILSDFDALTEQVMDREQLRNEQLEQMFGTARDAWMTADFDGWLNAQGFYDGVVEAANQVAERAVVITTKQYRFAVQLVERAGLRIPPERVYGLDKLGPHGKRGVLEAALAANPQATVHFFEDRIRTLDRMKTLPRTALYLVDWGYNTAAERARAAADADIELITRTRFTELLQAVRT